MEQRVIFRDRQELRPADLNNEQAFASQSLEHIASDGVGSGKYYSGLLVTQHSPTEIRVASGRYWDNGKIYIREENLQLGIQAEIFSLSEYLPTTYEKAIAAIVYGQEQDTDVEPRDYLIDLENQTTEPEAVPMTRQRLAVVSLVEGTEAAQPQIPPIPGGVVHFCTIYLQPTGIDRIEMVESSVVPSAEDNSISLAEFLAWKASVEAQIETLRAQLAALQELISKFAPLRDLRQLALDVARLKERFKLPDTYSQYAADWFKDADETDIAYTGYDARIAYGLLFPIDASATINLALLSAGDSSVVVDANDLALPAYTTVKRFGVSGYDGDTPMAVQSQSFEIRTFEIASYEHKYGWSLNNYGEWWSQNFNEGVNFKDGTASGDLDWPSKSTYAYEWTLQWNRNWQLKAVEHQYLAPTTTTIVGSLVAQTFLAPASMWLTEVEVFFTSVDTSGDVTVLVTECSATGKPLIGKTVAMTTKGQGDLRQYPNGTRIAIEPAFIRAGKRYAICLISQGSHRVAVASGENYTDGTLFKGTDGDFFAGDLTQNLKFNLWAARFANPRVEVALQPISLSGGISDLEFDAPAYVPEGSHLEYEIQVNGSWHPLSEPTYHLASLPDVIPLRAVFHGTSDVMPALILEENSITGSRAKTSFTHFSTLRTLTGASSEIYVKAIAFNYESGDHTLVASLVEVGGTEHQADVTLIQNMPDGSTEFTFEFSLAAAISEYRVKLSGTRSNTSTAPFVVTERMDIAV